MRVPNTKTWLKYRKCEVFLYYGAIALKKDLYCCDSIWYFKVHMLYNNDYTYTAARLYKFNIDSDIDKYKVNIYHNNYGEFYTVESDKEYPAQFITCRIDMRRKFDKTAYSLSDFVELYKVQNL